jgi:hypothetical protein
MTSSTRCLLGAMTMVLVTFGASAEAQSLSRPAPDPGPVEIGLGITFNGLQTDVNALPACAQLSFPCTHAKASDWGGFGLDLNVTSGVSDHVAITLGATIAAYDWDSWETIRTHRTATSQARALVVGPTIRSSFSNPRGPQQESDRVFGEFLVGFEDTTVFATHGVVQASVGVDSHAWSSGWPGRETTVRLELGYRATPGAPRPAGGLRFFIGVVFGPHSA